MSNYTPEHPASDPTLQSEQMSDGTSGTPEAVSPLAPEADSQTQALGVLNVDSGYLRDSGQHPIDSYAGCGDSTR
jgi:hypothetical protein